MVITSPCPGEGKSMVASNLAIALAAIGQRVLLIDGDMWKPGLHKVFAVPNDAGFADLLSSSGGPQELLAELTHQTEVPGLLPARCMKAWSSTARRFSSLRTRVCSGDLRTA
jgi:succinoglycan biosynthesis transport protein ExoP